MGLFDAIDRRPGSGDGSEADGHGGDRTGGTDDARDGSSHSGGEGNRAAAIEDRSDDRERAAALSYFRVEAGNLADCWWEYDLDRSPASVARLDALVAEEFSAARFEGVDPDPEGSPDERALSTLSRQVGSYLGEVIAASLGGEWRKTGAYGWAVVVEAGPGVTANAFRAARDSLRGDPRLAATYDAVAERTGGDPVGDVEAGTVVPYPTPDPGASPDEFADAADRLASYSTDLDFSPDSLSIVDELVRYRLFEGEVDLDAMDARRQARTIAQLGSHFGEVLRRDRGGGWRYDPDLGWTVVVDGESAAAGVEAFRLVVTALKVGETLGDTYERAVAAATDRAAGTPSP